MDDTDDLFDIDESDLYAGSMEMNISPRTVAPPIAREPPRPPITPTRTESRSVSFSPTIAAHVKEVKEVIKPPENKKRKSTLISSNQLKKRRTIPGPVGALTDVEVLPRQMKPSSQEEKENHVIQLVGCSEEQKERGDALFLTDFTKGPWLRMLLSADLPPFQSLGTKEFQPEKVLL